MCDLQKQRQNVRKSSSFISRLSEIVIRPQIILALEKYDAVNNFNIEFLFFVCCETRHYTIFLYAANKLSMIKVTAFTWGLGEKIWYWVGVEVENLKNKQTQKQDIKHATNNRTALGGYWCCVISTKHISIYRLVRKAD